MSFIDCEIQFPLNGFFSFFLSTSTLRETGQQLNIVQR